MWSLYPLACLVMAARDPSPGGGCGLVPQVNCVAGTPGLPHCGSSGAVHCLGTLATPAECLAACGRNSTAVAPCRAWAFYYPDTAEAEYRGGCYGRFDEVWAPRTGIPVRHNHVVSAKSCLCKDLYRIDMLPGRPSRTP